MKKLLPLIVTADRGHAPGRGRCPDPCGDRVTSHDSPIAWTPRRDRLTTMGRIFVFFFALFANSTIPVAPA